MKDKKGLKENIDNDDLQINTNKNINGDCKDISFKKSLACGTVIYNNANLINSLEFFFSSSNVCRNEKKYISKKISFSTNSKNLNHSKCIYSKFYSAVQKTLNKNYFFKRSDYDIIVVDSLIYNRKCHIVCVFKENMILDYVDEFLKRLYKTNESLERIPKFSNYYKNYLKFFCSPTFRDFKANVIIQNYGDSKAELHYNRNYGNNYKYIKPMNKNKEEVPNIFNTAIKENIDKNSLIRTHNSTRNYLVEMSIQGLDGLIQIKQNNKVDDIKKDRDEETSFNKETVLITNKENKKEITNLNLGEEFNFNANSFSERAGMYTKISTEVSLLNLLSHLNNYPEDDSTRDQISSNFKLSRSSNKPNVKIVKKITKSNEEKIIKEFQEKIMKVGSPSEIINSFVSVTNNNYFDTIPIDKADRKSLISYNTPFKQKSSIKISCSKDGDRHSNLFQTNNNQINQLKSPNTKGLNLNNFKNSKINKQDKNIKMKNILPNRNILVSSQINHLKNVYSSDSNTENYQISNLIKKLNSNNDKEKAFINISNSNSSNPNKALNKLTAVINEGIKNKQNKEERFSPVNKATYTKLKKQKISLINNNFSDRKIKNCSLKKISSNLNANYTTHNRLINYSSFNQNDPQTNNIDMNSVNDIMKITLSLYMDKSDRNQLSPEVGQATTQHRVQSQGMIDIFDSIKKSSIIGKVDTINNFNININNQININEFHINPNTCNIRGSSTKSTMVNTKPSTELNKNLSTNLKSLIEKNKNLSRNKNQSIYKYLCNQAKSNNLQEEDDIYRSSTKSNKNNNIKMYINRSTSNNEKIFKSFSNVNPATNSTSKNINNLVENQQVGCNKKDGIAVDDGINAGEMKKNIIIKQNIEDYRKIKKNSLVKTNFKSPIKFQSDLCSARNNNLLTSTMNLIFNPSLNEKKIDQIKLTKNSDFKKIINSNNLIQSSRINDNILNIKNNSKLMNLNQTTRNFSKNYFSSFKK